MADANFYPCHKPVQRNGSKAEHSGRAEELVQELDGLAEEERAEPQAAAWATGATTTQRHVEGHTHQGGTDARARQVLDEATRDQLEHVGVAGAPQHRGIAW